MRSAPPISSRTSRSRVEVVAELGAVLEGEREERCVRRERIRERDDLRRVERLGAKPLDDARRDGDRADDALDVTPPHLRGARASRMPRRRSARARARRSRSARSARRRSSSSRSATAREKSAAAASSPRRCGWIARSAPSSPSRRMPSAAPASSSSAGQLVAEPRRGQVADEPHLDARAERAAPCARRTGTRNAPRSGCRGRCASGRR